MVKYILVALISGLVGFVLACCIAVSKINDEK